MTLDEIIDDASVKEAIDHETALWEVAGDARIYLGASTPEKVLEIGLEICRRFYDRGVRPTQG